MQTGKNSIIEARILYYSNSYTYIVLLFAVKHNFMTLWLNTTINPSALSAFLYLIKHLLIFDKLFCVLNGELGRASHLVYKFDKEIARCNNSQIKILNLFEFPHVLAA